MRPCSCLTAAQVALEVGSVDQASLIRHFKGLSGVTLGHYRAAAPDP